METTGTIMWTVRVLLGVKIISREVGTVRVKTIETAVGRVRVPLGVMTLGKVVGREYGYYSE